MPKDEMIENQSPKIEDAPITEEVINDKEPETVVGTVRVVVWPETMKWHIEEKIEIVSHEQRTEPVDPANYAGGVKNIHIRTRHRVWRGHNGNPANSRGFDTGKEAKAGYDAWVDFCKQSPVIIFTPPKV